MEIDYVAFDSFGVKSSCTFIKTKNVNICIDPGIAIETDSFPLSFTKRLWLVQKYKRRIYQYCKKADVIVITHYHYDHHIPKADLYKNKTLLIKDPEKNINKSQKERANYFLSLVEKNKIEMADGKEFKYGSTKIKFSKPLWHGMEGTKLGKVIMVVVEEYGKKFVYSSDIDGPYIKKYAKIIANENPHVLVLDGFPSYLLGFLASIKNLRRSIKNTIYILENTKSKIILDHHLLRDYRFREIYYEVFRKAKELGRKINTAAEELGKEPEVITAYKRNGPTRWKKWRKFTFSYLNKAIKNLKK